MLFTSEHREMMQVVESFCETEINPYVREWEEGGRFQAHELFKKLGDIGLLGITKPLENGGSALDYSYQLAFCEALGASRCGSINLAVGVQTDRATPALAKWGSKELREEFLTPSISGEYVACLGVSETSAGSDFAAITTHAKKRGEDYVINGGKMWITNGTQADWICLLCVTNEGGNHINKSLICVPLNRPGVTINGPLKKLGLHASDTAQIFFDDVVVPQRYRIGQERRGVMYQMHTFEHERLWVAACGLRTLDRIIKETIVYTRERIVYGKPILNNQTVHFRLAELQSKVELLRSLIYRAVSGLIDGDSVGNLISMAKLEAGRLSREVIDSCLQFYGGMGFLHESEISRYYRDFRLTSIGGGADEVMLTMICRYLNILPTQNTPAI